MGDDRSGVEALIAWFASDGADLPWRRTRDRYAILVAETMLQATQVARVIGYYDRWLAKWPTVQTLAQASLGDVIATWQGLGYPRRARNLHRSAQIVAEHGWPQDLTTLPGVGSYTADALACFADEVDVIPQDVNVRRVIARRFGDEWPGTPKGQGWVVGQALMDLGRLYCTAKGPKCAAPCPLRQGCAAADLGQVAELTPAGRRQSPYGGSMRERRGKLLKEIALNGRVALSVDVEAANSLVSDGLARKGRTYLLPAR
jgi:A/G-specific adenine glycosylase